MQSKPKDTAAFSYSSLITHIRSFLFLAEQVKFGLKVTTTSLLQPCKARDKSHHLEGILLCFQSLFIASHKAISNATNHENTEQFKLFWMKTVNKALLRTIIK